MIILYNSNLVLNSFINVMVKNINIFNYKNTTQFTKNSYFYDILISTYYDKNNFTKTSLFLARENSLTVKLQSSKLLL